ncbi:MAG: hypothetical protein RBR86_04470 [Pseudobdellovibrionaceae bacterium]|nr:hypothetical protein [Pseudobdellovibrionaceae bacterium]
MASAPIVNYYTFSPTTVEAYLSKNDWTGCWEYLAEILKSFSSVFNPGINIMLQKDLEHDDQKSNVENFGKLLGELIFALLCDPSARLPDKNFLALIKFHEVLHNLFSLYGVEHTNEVVENILAGSKKLSDMDQKRILLLISLRHTIDIVTVLKRTDSKYRVSAYLSYMAYQSLYDRHVCENKIALYALRYDFERCYTDFDDLSTALVAYFNCSYLNIPERHLIKQNINRAVQKFVKSYQDQADFKRFMRVDSERFKPVERGTKPRMVIIMEIFSKGHAMVRSWGAWIKSLQSEFDTVIFTKDTEANNRLETEYGPVEIFANLGEFLRLFKKYHPDVMMLPSVGMEFFGIVSANMRLADVQIMGLGHPATTMSENMDFVYGPRQMYCDKAFPHETFIMDNAPYRFVANLSRDEVLSVPVVKRDKGSKIPLRVAVVGMPVKFSAPFIDFLGEIQNDAQCDIQFSFHIGSVGLETLCFSKAMKQRFSGCSFYGYKSYKDYLYTLAKADIILNPFPFGHTNTLIDTMLLGIPCMGLQDIEPASRTEAYILDILGYEDRFSAKTQEEYKRKFFDLAEEILAGQGPNIDRGYVYDKLYGLEQSYDFGKVIKWVYDNSYAIKKLPRKSFVALQDINEAI